jgi:hypothetical protein
MKKRLFSVLAVLLIATMVISPVSAGAAIKLSGVQFSLGSLIASGFASGLGNTDVTIELEGTGIPVISCINNGGNVVPGQSAPKVTATGTQELDGDDPVRKNGRSPFLTETDDPETIAWDVAGCPNANWTGHIDFIFWTKAKISVYNLAGDLLATKNYTCQTTRYPASVTCTEVK